MERRRLISSKEAATLLGIAVDEDSLIRHFTLDPADAWNVNFVADRRTSWASRFNSAQCDKRGGLMG